MVESNINIQLLKKAGFEAKHESNVNQQNEIAEKING